MTRFALASVLLLGMLGTAFGDPIHLGPVHTYSNFTDESCADTGCPFQRDAVLEPRMTPVSISEGYAVSNSFRWDYSEPVTVIYLALWSDDSPRSIGWSITTQPFGGTVFGSGTADEYNFLALEIARGVFYANIVVDVPLTPGAYWLQLSNGMTWDGLGSVAWDVSSGLSTAYSDNGGTPIPSESFIVAGEGAGVLIPEPETLTLCGTGTLAVLVLGIRKVQG